MNNFENKNQAYDFDTLINRKGTDSIKWDIPADGKIPEDVLPMWVADMDFVTAPRIRERLMEVVAHGIFGYTGVSKEYRSAVQSWFSTRFGWEIEPNWIVSTTGIVMALSAAVRAFTNEGDAILIQQPVYYPFSNVVRINNRQLVVNLLRENMVDGQLRYEMDFEDLEEKIKSQNVKMMILCNPHNPISRVWDKTDLERLCEICEKYQVQIVSDEIHCDFISPGFKHVPFMTLDCPWAKRAVVCTAPSKTFNLAGLQASNVIIADEELRKTFTDELNRQGIHGAGLFGLAACRAAYETGADWVDELNAYIYGNYQYMKSYIEEHLPKIKVIELQGTYLLWLDFRAYGYTDEELSEQMLNHAKIWVDDGTMFGAGGSGFMRINLATPRTYIEKALELLTSAFKC